MFCWDAKVNLQAQQHVRKFFCAQQQCLSADHGAGFTDAQPAFPKNQAPPLDVIKAMMREAEFRKQQGQHVLPSRGSRQSLVLHFDSH